MATKKKSVKKSVKNAESKCSTKDIMSGLGDIMVAGSILLGSITIYKMVSHLITINKLT